MTLTYPACIICICVPEKGKQRPDRKGQLVENLPTPWRFFRKRGEDIDATGSVTEGCLKYTQCFVSTTSELTFWFNVR